MGGELDLALFDKTASNLRARHRRGDRAVLGAAPTATRLNAAVASINAIERGDRRASFQVGVIPAHRASQSLAYADLFGETMPSCTHASSAS